MNFHRLPRRAVSGAPSGLRMEAAHRSRDRHAFAYRCGGSAGWPAARRVLHPCTGGVLLPVELRHANHTASTNALILDVFFAGVPTMGAMASGSPIDPLVDRVERLLVRYEELQRTNALLAEQVELLTQERDSLKSRLSAARARVDALLERLPDLNTPA